MSIGRLFVIVFIFLLHKQYPELMELFLSLPCLCMIFAGSPYPSQPGAYGQYGSSDQYNATGPPGQPFGQGPGQYPPQNRNMYPPYGPEGEA